MTKQSERKCPKCNRIFEWDDWQEDTCPFCDVPLVEMSDEEQATSVMDSTVSTEIAWPQGERETQVCLAYGYINAQMMKAQLESAGIPVLLRVGSSIGDFEAVPILVPISRAAEATEILGDDAVNR